MKIELENIYQQIIALIQEVKHEAFVVEIVLKRGKNKVLEILVDTDEGILLDECSYISKKLANFVDEMDFFDFPYNLEVSSPGVARPLKLIRQYQKNIGRELEIILKSGNKIEAELLKIDKNSIELKKKVKKEFKEVTVNFDEIKEAKVKVVI